MIARCLPGVLLLVLLGCRLAGGAPNFLVILADDLGIGDVSAYRQADVQTPHIDRLAAEGMRFTAMRANATVCSPSRAALLTGRHPDRVGVPGVIRTQPADSWGWLRPGLPTLADHLRSAGYHTALVGKWHLGLESPNIPNDRGFDHFHGFLGDMMDSYTTHLREGRNYLRRDRGIVEAEGHATDLFADWAIEYLRSPAREHRPFFLFLAFNAPHFPIEPPDAWLQRARQRLPGVPPARVRNIALVEHLDDAIGRVLRALDDLHLSTNTVVAFTSDNGGSLPHSQNNDPWRDGKQSHFDGGLRVPFVIRWPGQVPPRSESAEPAQVFDLFPTLLGIAGVPLPADLDAVSLVPRWDPQATPTPERTFYFVRREGGRGYGGEAYHAVLRGEWKLLRNTPFSPLELYRISVDPAERTNVIATHREIAFELGRELQRQIQRGGQVPWQQPHP